MTRQVTFNPCGIAVRVKEGESLLSTALDAGVHGNGSLQRATFLALSRELLSEERRVAAMTTNFDLSETPGFMENYVAALFLPQTRTDYFTKVVRRMNAHPIDCHRPTVREAQRTA